MAYRAHTNATYATRTNTTVNKPTGLANGDVLVLVHLLGAATTPPTPTPPSGFSAPAAGTWPWAETDGGGFTVSMRVWTKIVTDAASEPASYTVTHASASSAAYLGAYSGRDQTTPLAPAITQNAQAFNGGAASTTTIALGLTAPADSTDIIFVGQDWGDTANALTPPTGMTERVDGVILYVADQAVNAGATGNRSHTNNNTQANGNPWQALLISLQPPSEPTPWIASGSAATAASGNVTPALPGSLQTNDILVLDITARDNVDCSVATSGGSGASWTRKFAHNNGTNLRKEVWWKRRGAGDADTAAAVTHTGGGKIAAQVHQLRAPDAPTTGDPFEAIGGPSSIAAAASGTFDNVTTLTDNAFLMYFLGYAEDFTTGPSITNAQGLTITERAETEVT